MKLRSNLKPRCPLLILLPALGYLGAVTSRAADSIPLTMTVNTAAVHNAVPEDFEGLSFEEPTIVPDSSGRYYYNPRNDALVNLLRLIGIKNLRFGGTTVDGNNYKISHADIDNLFAFAKAVDTKVIYSLRLRNYPGEDKKSQYAAEALDAKYIMDHYATQLDCFCLGNEPNVFYHDFSAFAPDWSEFAAAIDALAPNAKFCGPGAWAESWVLPFARQFGKQGNIAYLAHHIYQSQAQKFRAPPGSSPEEIAHQEQLARAEMLAKSDFSNYYNGLGKASQESGLPYRIEETNSFSGGGVANASDAYSASLWGLNYQMWWASHGAKGLNFHTGYHSPNAKWLARYSVFESSPSGDQTPLGLSYAMLAFRLASEGQFLETTVNKGERNLNATTYAILGHDGAVYVTVINQEWGPSGRDASLAIHTSSFAISRVQTMALAQSTGDIGFRPGKSPAGSITLGNAAIDNRGGWPGKWSAADAADAHTVNVIVPSASAMIVKLSPLLPAR